MRSQIIRLNATLAAMMLALSLPFNSDGKGYSSGGHSYSSHSSSSSHSFSSGGGHSFSSGSTHTSSSGFGSSSRSSSGTKTFSSGGGKSYTSGSSSIGDRKGYSSGNSYSSGSGIKFSSGSGKTPGSSASVPKSSSSSSSGSSGLTFDSSAARARKEQASKSDFSRFKDSQKPPIIPRTSGNNSYAGRPPPIPSSARSYRRTVYVPDYTVIRTRPSRINVYFGSYGYRPWVYYNDPYSSLFWWWLLDRSMDEQAYWAYHHRYDMDPARYDSLM